MALLQRFSLVILLFTLVACGGSEGGFTNTDTDADTDTDIDTSLVTISLDISDINISDENPAILNATVLVDEVPLSGVLVTFTLNDGFETLATFAPELGTSITDDSGVASIILNSGGTAGAGIVTATFDGGDGQVTVTTSFNSAGDANTGETPNVANISLFASSQQIASSGAQEVMLTAIVKDNNNNLLENVDVSFAASSGQIEVTKAVTGPDGQATALLKTNNAQSNRIISITAESTDINDSVDVEVVGTIVQLTGSTSLAINDSNEFIVNVLDSDGNGISNAFVTLSTSAGVNIDLPSSITTDSTGQATVSIIGTAGGNYIIEASALGASTTQSVSVQADSFLFSGFNDGNGTNINLATQSLDAIPDVLLSNTATLTLMWLRSGVVVPDGTLINFSATRGDLSTTSATTINGQVSTMLTSTNAGKSLVTFSGVDGAIALNNQLEFEFIAETADRIVAQASPNSIEPNFQQSTISVVVTDPTGNLVKNKQVDFTLTDISGGSIFPASAVTDSNGNASTIYTSNTVSAQNAVSIRTVVRDTPFVSDTVTLTVADRELFISLGTGNQLEEPEITQYNKQFSVFVTDVDSTPVENVELTVSAVPRTYYKGEWIQSFDESGSFVSWITASNVRTELSDPTDPDSALITLWDPKHACLNEDKNIDGIIDAGEDDTSDGNGNGNGELTPGNVVVVSGDIVTDENGSAIIDITYAQSFGSWVDIDLIVSAKVRGTEGSTQTTFTLSTLSSDLLDEDITPPTSAIGTNSPFGVANDCTNPN